jgi:hypothetical protein
MEVVMAEAILPPHLVLRLVVVVVVVALEAQHLLLAEQVIHRQQHPAKEIAAATEPDQIKPEVVVVPVL